MADVSKTIEELEEIFRSLTVSMLGTSPTPDVRISWPEDGAPAWKITENVTFLQVIEKDDRINRQRDESFIASSPDSEVIRVNEYTRVIQISWTFYGPDSYENSQLVRDGLFLQEYHDVLADDEIYLIPDIAAPRRAPELFQGRWWKRCDMAASFNEKIRKETTVNTIESAEMVVNDYSGIVADVTATAND